MIAANAPNIILLTCMIATDRLSRAARAPLRESGGAGSRGGALATHTLPPSLIQDIAGVVPDDSNENDERKIDEE